MQAVARPVPRCSGRVATPQIPLHPTGRPAEPLRQAELGRDGHDLAVVQRHPHVREREAGGPLQRAGEREVECRRHDAGDLLAVLVAGCDDAHANAHPHGFWWHFGQPSA